MGGGKTVANRATDVVTVLAWDERRHVNPTTHCPTPSREEGGRDPVPAGSTRCVDLRISLVRGPAWLPWRGSAEELPASDVLRAARAAAGRPGAFLVGGGEPLRRADLLGLLRDLFELRPDNLGLTTTGAGLTRAVVEHLRSAGVQRLHVPFHCARRDAHDWLVGQPGALKAALRAIRTCVDAGMPVVAEVGVTRPTMPHLAETVGVLTHVGVRTICLRRLSAADVGTSEFILLSPRMSLVADDLEAAATTALQRRARLVIRDFPVCVAPRLSRLFAVSDSEATLTPDGVVESAGEGGPGCPGCPGPPACAGAPPDYVARFGWEEFADPVPSEVRIGETVVAQQHSRGLGAMAFTWRGPRRVRCDACGDAQPSAGPESTRAVRARLVDAARHRPAVLRLVGAELLAHPSAAALLFDAVRLFARVECAGEGSTIVGWSDLDLRRLKDLHRIDVAFYGPDATTHDGHCGIPGSFAATLRGVERLRAQTSIAVGAYAIVHEARAIPRFVAAWSRGELPGRPRFRLAGRGGSLDELVERAREVPPGDARSALTAVLPHCLCEQAGLDVDDGDAAESAKPEGPQYGVSYGRRVPWAPCGSDPVGAFAGCLDGKACAMIGCPGTALGWQRSARAERWMLES